MAFFKFRAAAAGAWIVAANVAHRIARGRFGVMVVMVVIVIAVGAVDVAAFRRFLITHEMTPSVQARVLRANSASSVLKRCGLSMNGP